MLGRPPEFVANLGGAGDQHGSITGATGGLAGLDSAAGHAPRGFDDLAHAESAAAAQVVDQRSTLAESIKSEHVRLSQVADVNVIANAGAVGRGVVGTEDGDGFSLSGCSFQNEGNQMRFGMVALA